MRSRTHYLKFGILIMLKTKIELVNIDNDRPNNLWHDPIIQYEINTIFLGMGETLMETGHKWVDLPDLFIKVPF